ncbi:MAG TPA: hypothetical protein RMH99_24175 [Sandaracinaceae bacterium LLY-WYZ-13_1]|nr:hypothetical protein [Sandaracinaceae bacterium LLY-WYZ-13_1]
MYCLTTIGLLFAAFAAYQVFWGLRDLRLAARLRRGEATPIGSLRPGGLRVVVGTAQLAEGLRSPRSGRPLAWLRARLAHLAEDPGAGHPPPVRLLLDHEPEPLILLDDSGAVEVRPRRSHDALPRPARDELTGGLPPGLERALRERGLEDVVPTTGSLWYEEHGFEPGVRLFAVGRVRRASAAGTGGAYRGGRGSPARIEDAVVSPDTPEGLARPYRNRGWMLALGGLILGGLGAAMLAVAGRQLLGT